MANRTATLVINANVPGIGWRKGLPIQSKNGKMKPGFMLYDGTEVEVPNPKFYIRHYKGGKAVYTTVGTTSYEAAGETLNKHLASLRMAADQATLGITPPTAEPEKPKEKLLAEYATEFMSEKRSPSHGLSSDSIYLYDVSITGFLEVAKKRFVSELTKQDVEAYINRLIADGYAVRTRKTRYTALRGFLMHCGVAVDKLIDKTTHKRLKPKTQQNVEPYTVEQTNRLMAASDHYHKMVWQLLLSTGLREQEAMHLTWENVRWDTNMFYIPASQTIHHRKSKKIVKFKCKTNTARFVPMFPTLKASLTEWRKQHPDTIYVLGTKSDLPNGHWLRSLKKVALEAGLNCDRCESCSKRNQCATYKLHKFRHTYAFRCLQNRITIHQLSSYLGHHNISVTAIYLSGSAAPATGDPFADVA